MNIAGEQHAAHADATLWHAGLPDDAVVAVAMSGGVDSSVAALRLVAAGISTVGITLALWPKDREQVRDRGCCSLDAVEDARRVAALLGIPHYAWDLEEEFHSAVIDAFAAGYAAGKTPNPCITCNEQIKFGVLLERARAVGASHVATGHYARRVHAAGRVTLHRGADPAKDQSYTLYRLNQDQLDHALFPVGDAPSKRALREEARAHGLPTADKADSQELCFVNGSVREDLRSRLAGQYQPGPIVHVDGRRIGEHGGIPFYTVGQRSRIPSSPVSPSTEPLYVVAIEAEVNTVVVGPRSALERQHLVLESCSWIDPSTCSACPRSITVQLRAHGIPEEGTLLHADLHSRTAEITTPDPVVQVAPGQSCVVYDGDRVLGGGIIREAH